MAKTTSLRATYEKHVNSLRDIFLSENKPKASVIDIHLAYNRSAFTLGSYLTLDYTHKQNINRIRNNIIKYSTDLSLTRPLNIIMVAEPGLGKSHFVKSLAKSISKRVNVASVSFNMSSFREVEDFIVPLDQVRNYKMVDTLPILFLDEFDSDTKNFSRLLPLLWDGELHISHHDLKLGKVIIILAGSDNRINELLQTKEKVKNEDIFPGLTGDEKKLPDLLSRINGGIIEIPTLDLNTDNRDRRVDKICIAISILQNRFGEDLQFVPWGFLHFVGMTDFRYSVRSIVQLVELLNNEEIQNGILPKSAFDIPQMRTISSFNQSSLSFHIKGESARNILDFWEDCIEQENMVRFVKEEKEEKEQPDLFQS